MCVCGHQFLQQAGHQPGTYVYWSCSSWLLSKLSVEKKESLTIWSRYCSSVPRHHHQPAAAACSPSTPKNLNSFFFLSVFFFLPADEVHISHFSFFRWTTMTHIVLVGDHGWDQSSVIMHHQSPIKWLYLPSIGIERLVRLRVGLLCDYHHIMMCNFKNKYTRPPFLPSVQ